MLLGVDYSPEQWDESRWETDAQLMQEAGLGLVRLAQFAWSRLEPRRQKYEFGWLDRAMDVLARHGLRVMLCTPTTAPPAWLVERHPSILPCDAHGVRQQYGVRRSCCISNEPYRKYVRRIVSEMGRHYKDHPAVVGWQVDSPLGASDAGRCFCEGCAQAFREWLYKKYGSLARLNQEWGTVFWSQEFSEWHQIPVPSKAVAVEGRCGHSPSLCLDFHRFCSASVVDFVRMQSELIRSICPPHSITHHLTPRLEPVDGFELMRDLDFASQDNHPSEIGNVAAVALGHDIARGLKGKPFWVMGQQAGATGCWVHTPAPRPGQLRLWTYQALAHGAETVIFFRWRTARMGPEQCWSGILNHDGVPQRRYHEIAQVGKEIRQHGEALSNARTANRVALILSYDSNWALQIHPHHPGLTYWTHFRRMYDALHGLGIGVDIVHRTQSLSNYALVLAPTLYLVDDAIADNLKSYVSNGGTLLLTFRSGVANMSNVVSDRRLPSGLSDLVGVAVDEFDALKPSVKNGLRFNRDLPFTRVGGREYIAHTWCDIVQLCGAESLAEYTAEFYAQTPALTLNAFGNGKAYYLATLCEPRFYRSFLEWLAREVGVESLAAGA
ncbi:MAG: beta-galactosidase, partial [Planctomycetes bacterium]|nr:beta-galactosidase [Planctomycetota bacterium]